MRKNILLFIIGLPTLFIRVEGAPVDSTRLLNEVVVTATKTRVVRNNVPLTISILERDEIEQTGETALLPILSQRIPGLFVTQRGITGFGVSAGSAGSINIRGVGQGNKVLMLLDGQPQYAGLFGHSLPDTYVASDAERVEVIRGAASLLYGTNAMGGVVNVLTRQQTQEGATLQARAMYGSYNTQKYLINGGIKQGAFDGFVSLNHDRTDGHRPNSNFHITNGFAKLGYTFSPHLKLSANANLSKAISHNPGMESAPMLNGWVDMMRGASAISFENNYAYTNGSVRVFTNWGTHLVADGNIQGTPELDYMFNSKDHNSGIMLNQSFRLIKGNEFTVGLDYKNWGGSAWNSFDNGERKDLATNLSVNETAAYIIAQQSFLNYFHLNAGVRYEYNDQYGGYWVPQAGVSIRYIPTGSAKLSFSKGFRSPNIRELYMFPPQNPNLQPEEMYNYEFSINNRFLSSRLFLQATLFYIDGKNMIQTLFEGGKPHNINTGTFQNSGIEIESNYQLSKAWNIDLNYSYLHTSTPMIASPRHQLFGAVHYRYKRLNASLNVHSIGKLYLNTKEGTTIDYTLLNARVSYCLLNKKPKIDLFIKGENLTNTTYSINDGFTMPGIVAFIGFDIKL